MSMNELSMLSDDLRPRDTPNHTLFKDFVLNPIVPDLSITEEPATHQSNASVQSSHSSGPRSQRPLLEECKTYSEWRRKSSQSASVSGARNFTHNNSYDHYMEGNFGGMSKHTVLDSLNTSSTLQGLHMQPPLFTSGRQTSTKESGNHGHRMQMANKISRKPQNQLESQSMSSRPLAEESHVLAERETLHHFSAPGNFTSAKPNSRGECDGSVGHYQVKNSKQFVNNHPEVASCVTCSHWPHQPVTGLTCNGMPVCHSYPHGGSPSCSAVPRNIGMKPVPSLSSKSANASRNRSSNSVHSCGDSVIYDNLYQIVLSQSEQLRLLQNQVEKLLISQELKNNGSMENSRLRCQNEHCGCNATSIEKSTQTSDSEMNANESEKMSIGVMTSFVHTVAYAGRVELVDSRCKGANQANMNAGTENRNRMTSGNSRSTCTSPPSQPFASSQSGSSTPSPPQMGCQKKCCRRQKCVANSSGQKTLQRRQIEMKSSKIDQLEEALGGKKPGVSAAIRAVRGCQEVLATVSNACQPDGAEVDESITLNGVDLPTVVEQPISPPSSIHVDMQDYHSSSSDQDESSFNDDQSSSYDSNDQATHRQAPNGWTFYQSVLGQVNQLLEDKDKGSAAGDTSIENYSSGKGKTRRDRREKWTVDSPSDAVQANSVLKRVAFQQESKQPEVDSTENFKQLALNYLRENHPEELASSNGYTGLKTPGAHRRVQDLAVYNLGNNMSFATFRYLERYNLLPENFKINRVEELPGNTGNALRVQSNVDNRAVLTNGAFEPSRRRAQTAAGANIQNMNAGPSNGIDFTAEDRAGRTLRTHHREKTRGSRPHSHKQSSKPRHKRYLPQTDLGNPVATAVNNGQQNGSAPTYKILDITALRQQPKLL